MKIPTQSLIALAAAALLAPAAASALADPGWVSLVQGEVLMQGAEDSEWTYADRNVAVVEGDLLWNGTGALVEIQLPEGVVLRAGPDARFEVVELDPVPVIRHASGPLYVCSRRTARNPAARILTPGAVVEIEREAAARLDVNVRGGTRLTMRLGSAWYEAQGEGAYLDRGERVYVDPGLLPSEVVTAGEEDDFDLWVRDACQGVVIEQPGIAGLPDLGREGRWTLVDGMRVWVPNVSSAWRPYSNGWWTWLPRRGWSWVAVEPWGWATHHYGSWIFVGGLGWAWVPGTTWHGGNVAWVQVGDALYWTPLDPAGRPVLIAGDVTIHLGGLLWSRGAACFAQGTGIGRGVIEPRARLPEHIGPVSPHHSVIVGQEPSGAGRRGGRTEDPSAGEARERARAIAERAALLRDAPERRATSYEVSLPAVRTVDRGAKAAPASGTAASAPGRWREAPVVLPEARAGALPAGTGGSAHAAGLRRANAADETGRSPAPAPSQAGNSGTRSLFQGRVRVQNPDPGVAAAGAEAETPASAQDPRARARRATLLPRPRTEPPAQNQPTEEKKAKQDDGTERKRSR